MTSLNDAFVTFVTEPESLIRTGHVLDTYARGGKFHGRLARSPDELIPLQLQKFLDEIGEARFSHGPKFLEELADIYEVWAMGRKTVLSRPKMLKRTVWTLGDLEISMDKLLSHYGTLPDGHMRRLYTDSLLKIEAMLLHTRLQHRIGLGALQAAYHAKRAKSGPLDGFVVKGIMLPASTDKEVLQRFRSPKWTEVPTGTLTPDTELSRTDFDALLRKAITRQR